MGGWVGGTSLVTTSQPFSTNSAAQSLERDDTLNGDSPTMKSEITYAQLPHTHLLTAYKYCRLRKTRGEQKAVIGQDHS